MVDYQSVLNSALQLSDDDRLRLIEALWDLIPPDADLPLHPDWAAELDRRVTALEHGAEKTISWEEVRAAALDRIGHGKIG